MLTNTIRALALLGLIAIAHEVRPLSAENISSFARHTLRSFVFVLPAEAKAELAQVSAAATLVSRGWVAPSFFVSLPEESFLAFYPGEPDVPAKVAARRTVTRSHRMAKPTGWLVASQVKVRSHSLAAPLPFIPGIEASLIQEMNLMVLPIRTQITLPQFLNDHQLKSDYTDCEEGGEPLWQSDDTISKPFRFVTPVRASDFSPQAINGPACGQQPGKPLAKLNGKSC